MTIVPKKFRSSPLKFLFYLNFILLSLAFLSIFTLRALPFYSLEAVNIFCLVIFALMGFKIGDIKQQYQKTIYLSLEFFLIVLAYLGGMKLYVLLFLVLLLRNCFILEQATRLTVTVVVFILILLAQSYRMNNLQIPPAAVLEQERLIIFAVTTTLFGLVVFFLQLLVNAVLSEYNSRRKLAIANEKLRRYAAKIEDVATLQERNRIAREIHDSLGHSLTIFNLHLEAALKILPSDTQEATELLKEAKQVGKTALKDVRQSVSTLRSKPLEGKSLQDAIATLIEDLERSTGISPQCNINISRPISDEVKIATYRILQEALTNICKYARSTEVIIKIETNNDLKLTVQDNGIGFILDENTTGFGLQGMFERTKANGGYCKIVTAPDRGCKISVSLPLNLPIV